MGHAYIMIANYVPLNADPNVPEIVRTLRNDLDDRLMALYKEAMMLIKDEQAGTSETVHVHYEFQGLLVTAVFNGPLGHFTQLIARSATEQDEERPSYTISLFLTAV